MATEADNRGISTDPKIRDLEARFDELSYQWGLANGDPEKRIEIIDEYHKVLTCLYQEGWDREIDYSSQLPEEFMPNEYLKRNPPVA